MRAVACEQEPTVFNLFFVPFLNQKQTLHSKTWISLMCQERTLWRLVFAAERPLYAVEAKSATHNHSKSQDKNPIYAAQQLNRIGTKSAGDKTEQKQI
jgi:hypothetical protein